MPRSTMPAMRLIATLMLAGLMVSPARLAGADGGGRDLEPPAPTRTPSVQPVTPAPAPRVVTPRAPVIAPRPVRQPRVVRPRAVEVAPSGQPPEGETRFLVDEVIVRYQLASTPQGRNRAIRGLGMTHLSARTFTLAGVTVHRYRLRPGADLRETIAALEASPAVVNAQPNYLYTLQQSDSPAKLPQFGNERIALAGAHAITTGADTRIAVIDTSVNGAHPELASASLRSFDVTEAGGTSDPHGTSVAGILAADTRLTGVAPEAEILDIAAFSTGADGATQGNSWTVLEALNVAFDEDADVLNMSFAGPADSLVERAMNGAVRLGMLPVAAAGNEGPEAATLYPAGYDAVIAVTATDAENAIYAKANAGAHIDIAAPGVGLLVLGSGKGFRTLSGTSMATAYVSGLAALALSANPGASPAQIRALLETSATDLGAPGKDSTFGAGLPNAAVAVGGVTN
jgi:subtilisin family serine protease